MTSPSIAYCARVPSKILLFRQRVISMMFDELDRVAGEGIDTDSRAGFTCISNG